MICIYYTFDNNYFILFIFFCNIQKMNRNIRLEMNNNVKIIFKIHDDDNNHTRKHRERIIIIYII